jgi:ADP-ribose pyrophosphatase YjhB (NUDIX family)
MSNVLVFVVNEDKRHMLLVQRKQPDNEAGKYNGVSAAVAQGEDEKQAAVRALQDKIGLSINPADLKLRAVVNSNLYVYYLETNAYAVSYRGHHFALFDLYQTNWSRESWVGYNKWLIPLVLNTENVAYVRTTEVVESRNDSVGGNERTTTTPSPLLPGNP